MHSWIGRKVIIDILLRLQVYRRPALQQRSARHPVGSHQDLGIRILARVVHSKVTDRSIDRRMGPMPRPAPRVAPATNATLSSSIHSRHGFMSG